MRAIDQEAIAHLEKGGWLSLPGEYGGVLSRLHLSKGRHDIVWGTLLLDSWEIEPIPPETTTDLKVALSWADAGDNAEAGGYLLCKTSGSRPGYQIVNNWAHAIGLSTWPAEMLTGPWTRVKS